MLRTHARSRRLHWPPIPVADDMGARVAVVGSGIAGLRAAEAVLDAGVGAQVVLIGDETYPTYARPGLTKKTLSTIGGRQEDLLSSIRADRPVHPDLTWRLNTRVNSADLSSHELHLSTGARLHYDRLVIASGLRSRDADSGGKKCMAHSHVSLRGLEDARHIHGRLQAGGDVAILGSGFIGCEVAALACAYGCRVTIVGPRYRGLLGRVLGSTLSDALANWFVANGVNFIEDGQATTVTCGGPLECTFVSTDPTALGLDKGDGRSPLYIEATGSIPNAEWLAGNRLDLSDGVLVDARMRVLNCADAFAAGDVARYPKPWGSPRSIRVESWKNAIDTGRVAGQSVACSLDCNLPTASIKYLPMLSTVLFGLRIQIAGYPSGSDTEEFLAGSPERLKDGVLVRYFRGDVPSGVVYIDTEARMNGEYARLARSLKLRTS